MRYVAAYCLLALGGKSPSAKDLKNLLDSVGVDYDAAQAEKVVSELDGKSLEELINEGMAKLGTMPATGGGGGAPGAAAAAETEAPAAEAKEEEPEEESDDDMGFGLFD